MPVTNTTPLKAEKSWLKVYPSLAGLLIGLSLLKFGNPVILDYRIEPPKGFWEFAIQSWPVAWGYWILGVVVLLGTSLGRWKVTKPSWMMWLPLAWLIWQFMSATQTVSAELTHATLKHFVACVVSFYWGFFILSELKDSSRFWGVVLACFAMVIWMGLDQHFGGLERLRRFVYEETRPEQLSPEFLKKLGSNRIFSTLVYPNAFAGVILLLFPPLVVWLWDFTIRMPNVVRGVLVGFFTYVAIACLYWSGSKSGWLIALIMLLIALTQANVSKWAKLLAMGTLIFVGLLGFALRHSSYFERGASSVGARFDYWRAALQVGKENPMWGSGPGTFSIPYKRIKGPQSEMTRLAHNDYLEQFSDSGIAGFLLFCASIISLMTSCCLNKSMWTDQLKFAGWLGLCGWVIQGTVEFGLYIPAIAWSAFGMMGWLAGSTLNEIDNKTKALVDGCPV